MYEMSISESEFYDFLEGGLLRWWGVLPSFPCGGQGLTLRLLTLLVGLPSEVKDGGCSQLDSASLGKRLESSDIFLSKNSS